MRGPELPQSVFVGRRRRIEHPEDQRDVVLGDGNLDLRQARANRQRTHEVAQRREQPVDRFGKNLAALHIRNKRCVALPKPDQCAALGPHILHRQPRPPSVVPDRAGHRLEPGIRLDAADALEIVAQRLLLDPALLLDTDVLERAAAAALVGRAMRLDTLCRRFVDLQQFGFIEIPVGLAPHEGDDLAFQRAGDEGFLALRVGNPAAIMGDPDDCSRLRFAALLPRHQAIPARPREIRSGGAGPGSPACRARAGIRAAGPCRRDCRA